MSHEARRILLVDDQIADCKLAESVLNNAMPQIHLVVAGNAVEFAQQLMQSTFSALIVNNHLSWLDSLQTITLARRVFPDIPVLFFSNSREPDAEYKAYSVGADHYLVKDSAGFLSLPGILRRLLAYPNQENADTQESLTKNPLDNNPKDKITEAGQLQPSTTAAAHDLQEPLGLIARYARLFKDRYAQQLDSDARRYIDYMLDSSQRLQQQVNSILATATPADRYKDFQAVDLNVIIDQIVADLRDRMDQLGVSFTRTTLPTVQGDATQLLRLFQNLFSNALKFSGTSAPHITLTSVDEKDSWRISLRDNGIGIAPADQERIFQPFTRLHSTEQYSGTGLGLSICKEIAEAHGGRIRVQSAPNKGSTFSITLPKPQR